MTYNKNIALIGLMGAGKTSVGKLLAKNLGYNFIDIDDLIELKEKMKISEIFKIRGENYFRQIETQTIKDFSKNSNQVISTGGGAPQNPDNLKTLKSSCFVVYLYAPVTVLYERLLNEIDNRPMLHTENPKQKLHELLEKREPYYLKADIKVDTANKTPGEVVSDIIACFSGGNV
jgi:shikimate kinase